MTFFCITNISSLIIAYKATLTPNTKVICGVKGNFEMEKLLDSFKAHMRVGSDEAWRIAETLRVKDIKSSNMKTISNSKAKSSMISLQNIRELNEISMDNNITDNADEGSNNESNQVTDSISGDACVAVPKMENINEVDDPATTTRTVPNNTPQLDNISVKNEQVNGTDIQDTKTETSTKVDGEQSECMEENDGVQEQGTMEANNTVVNGNNHKLGYRITTKTNEDESSSSCSSSEDEAPPEVVSDNEQSDEDGKNKKEGTTRGAQSIPKTKGELALEDLPPIGELHVTVGADVVMEPAGAVIHLVGVLAIVKGNKDIPALDENTIFFLEDRQAMGQIHEIFGPVSQPLYQVRFNSTEDMERLGVVPGLKVYHAPKHPEYTRYIFLSQLQRLKGSDASWEHNNEPPPNYVDYSDDEEEKRAKAKRGSRRGGGQQDGGRDEAPEKRGRDGHEGRAKPWRKHGGKPSRHPDAPDSDNDDQAIDCWPPKPRHFKASSYVNPQFRPPRPPQVLPPGGGHQHSPQLVRQPRGFPPQTSAPRVGSPGGQQQQRMFGQNPQQWGGAAAGAPPPRVVFLPSMTAPPPLVSSNSSVSHPAAAGHHIFGQPPPPMQGGPIYGGGMPPQMFAASHLRPPPPPNGNFQQTMVQNPAAAALQLAPPQQQQLPATFFPQSAPPAGQSLFHAAMVQQQQPAASTPSPPGTAVLDSRFIQTATTFTPVAGTMFQQPSWLPGQQQVAPPHTQMIPGAAVDMNNPMYNMQR